MRRFLDETSRADVDADDVAPAQRVQCFHEFDTRIRKLYTHIDQRALRHWYHRYTKSVEYVYHDRSGTLPGENSDLLRRMYFSQTFLPAADPLRGYITETGIPQPLKHELLKALVCGWWLGYYSEHFTMSLKHSHIFLGGLIFGYYYRESFSSTLCVVHLQWVYATCSSVVSRHNVEECLLMWWSCKMYSLISSTALVCWVLMRILMDPMCYTDDPGCYPNSGVVSADQHLGSCIEFPSPMTLAFLG